MEAGLNPEFRVLTRPEQIIFLRERLWKLPLDRFRPLGDPTRNLVALLTMVSRAKDEDVSPGGLDAGSSHTPCRGSGSREAPAGRPGREATPAPADAAGGAAWPSARRVEVNGLK